MGDPDILDHAFKIGMVTPTGIVGMVRKGAYDDISTGGVPRTRKGDYCGCSEDTKAQIDLTICALVWRAYVSFVKKRGFGSDAEAVIAEAKPRLAECMRVIKRNGGISEYERVTLPKETRAYLADWVSSEYAH